jgi:hypothetical protein
MTFHEYKHAMSVMDGNRCVASARLVGMGWLLSLRAASWVDPRARTEGLFPGKFPHLLTMPTRVKARRAMQALANTGSAA